MKIRYLISLFLVTLHFFGNTGMIGDLLFAGVSNISGEKKIITALSHLCGDYYSDSNLKPGNMARRLRIVANFIVIADGGQVKGKEYCLVTGIRKENGRYTLDCSKDDLPGKYRKMVKSNARNLNFLFLIEDELGKIVLKTSENDKEGSVFYK